MVSKLPREALSYSVDREPVVYLKDQYCPATERVQCRQSIAGHGRVQLVNSNKLATLSFKS